MPVLLYGRQQRVVRLPGRLHVHTRPSRHSHVCPRMSLNFIVSLGSVPEYFIVFFFGASTNSCCLLILSQQYSSEDAVPEHEEADRLQSFLRM